MLGAGLNGNELLKDHRVYSTVTCDHGLWEYYREYYSQV